MQRYNTPATTNLPLRLCFTDARSYALITTLVLLSGSEVIACRNADLSRGCVAISDAARRGSRTAASRRSRSMLLRSHGPKPPLVAS